MEQPIPEHKNICGPQVRRIRIERGWTQEQFATKCQLGGWDISRASISKIEAEIRRVTDEEVVLLAKYLECSFDALLSGK